MEEEKEEVEEEEEDKEKEEDKEVEENEDEERATARGGVGKRAWSTRFRQATGSGSKRSFKWRCELSRDRNKKLSRAG
jgi:hypothetical protein